ncbi:MAG: TerC family protein [Proteobacteria bacterium]|nr:TerC family protein [Pseudomonadota bacterium]
MWDFSIFLDANSWMALVTLTAMEIVLGIDNIVFISILTDKLPKEQQSTGRRIGLSLALITRLGLLFALSWVMRLTTPLFKILDHPFSGRDLILLIGGLFLMAKATREMFEKLEMATSESTTPPVSGFASVLIQIMLLDIVFSLDSVITAVGMAEHVLIMVIAMIIAVLVMLIFANAISDFVNRRPSMKILALSFLLLIGVMLMAEGLGQHINKGYIYFAMGFSLFVEIINLRLHKGRAPVQLNPSTRDPRVTESA